MVEMNKSASILNNISDDSLILLTKLVAEQALTMVFPIAWAIAEFFIASSSRPKTLFATHYHELNELANTMPRIKNFNAFSVKEMTNKVIFLRKLVPGGSEHSFGIHVTKKMAGSSTETNW